MAPTSAFTESRAYRDALAALRAAHPDFDGLDASELAQAEAAAEAEGRIEAGRKVALERQAREAAEAAERARYLAAKAVV